MAALVVLVAAILSMVAGFAFSALAGGLIFHITQTGVEAVGEANPPSPWVRPKRASSLLQTFSPDIVDGRTAGFL